MKDKTGNSNIETNHSRVTGVSKRPSEEKDWTGGKALRIQARRSSGRLHMGAEIPIEDLPDIMKGLAQLLVG